jgi:hypothetical protein
LSSSCNCYVMARAPRLSGYHSSHHRLCICLKLVPPFIGAHNEAGESHKTEYGLIRSVHYPSFQQICFWMLMHTTIVIPDAYAFVSSCFCHSSKRIRETEKQQKLSRRRVHQLIVRYSNNCHSDAMHRTKNIDSYFTNDVF